MNKIKAIKFASAILAGMLAAAPMTGVAALQDITFGSGDTAMVGTIGNKSTASTQKDYQTALGKDFAAAEQTKDLMDGISEEQSANTVYEKATSNAPETTVYADKASSDVMVAVPKAIVLDGSVDKDHASEGLYSVAVRGNVDPNYDVVVKPDAKALEMVNTGNAAIKYNATVEQDGVLFNGMNIPMEFGGTTDVDGTTITPMVHTGKVSQTIKRTGSYKGTMKFVLGYDTKNTSGLGADGADAAVVSATGADLAAKVGA